MADTNKETFTVECGVPMKKEENVDESASPAVECMVKKEEGSTKDSNSGGAFAFSAKDEVKLEEKVLGVVKKEEEKVKKEDVGEAFPAGEENVVKTEEGVKSEVGEEEDPFARLARENMLSDDEDEVRRDIWEITMEVKASEGLEERRVRAAHTKRCGRCGYNGWCFGDTYYSAAGDARWAVSEKKFCRSCYDEWLREDLDGYEVTPEMQSLRDKLADIARWREANNWPRRSEVWKPNNRPMRFQVLEEWHGGFISSFPWSCFSDASEGERSYYISESEEERSCFSDESGGERSSCSDESEGESDESGGERSSKIRRTGD
ncbi:hypothetical protein BSKO_13746 [Bryopsis sp. KO-2023]|nr:hypothetical protein BSKO_13746 [Bryopsis sp. KO-2023]